MLAAGLTLLVAAGALAAEKRAAPAPNFYVQDKPTPAKRRTPAPTPTSAAKKVPTPKRQSAQRPAAKAARASAAKSAPARKAKSGFPLDPYRLTYHFAHRWDLLNVLVDEAGRRAYIEEALEGRTRLLNANLDTLHAQIEKRRLEVRHKALALYLLGRAQDCPMYARYDIAAPHEAAIHY